MSGVRLLRDDEAYASATGRIRALETRLLDRARLERLLDAQPLTEAYRQLSETDYGTGYDAHVLQSELDGVLARETARTYSMVRGFVPDPVAVDFLAVRFDMNDAQAELRGQRPRTAWRLGPLAHQSPDPAEYGDVPALLVPFIEAVASARGGRHRPSEADALVNRAGFSVIRELARASGSEDLVQLGHLFADTANILAIIRGKVVGRNPLEIRNHIVTGALSPDRLAALAQARLDESWTALSGTPYEHAVRRGLDSYLGTRLLDALEREFDDLIVSAARAGRRVAMGPEAVAGYLVGKEFEQRNLRLIFYGRAAGLPADEIRQRLRDTYA